MDTISCAHQLPDFKQAIIQLATRTSADIATLQSLGRKLETTLQAASNPGVEDEQALKQSQQEISTGSSRRRLHIARTLFRNALRAFGSDDALLWESLERPKKRLCPTPESRAADAKLLEDVVQRVQAVLGSSATLQLRDASGRASKAADATEVLMTCPGMFCASVSFSSQGQCEPMRVMTFSPEERGMHPWGSSSFYVHRRVSAIATRAMHFFLGRERTTAASQTFSSPQEAPQAFLSESCVAACEDLLLWLGTFTDLFSRPCSITGTLLAADVASQLMLPPLVRPFKVSHEQLLAAAADPSKRTAFHLHAAPLDIV